MDEKNLQELESKSASTHIASTGNNQQKRCLILLNNQNQLSKSIQWIQSHGMNLNELVVVVQQSEEVMTSPLVFKLERNQKQSIPTFLSEIVNTISDAHPVPYKLTIYALPSLQLASTTTNLLRDQKIDLVLIVGCQSLTRGQYESNSQQPLIEEIILKQAIQPVILFK